MLLIFRLVIFIAILFGLSLWETRYPWRKWLVSRKERWINHVSLRLISQLAVLIVFPLLPIGIAVIVEGQQLGLFHQLSLPIWLNIVLGVIVLDAVMYWQHRLLHKYRFLWRFHQIHHMDRQIDVTTGLRFHPIEMLFTTAMKMAGIGFFGIHFIGVVIFEILYSAAILFTHVNVLLSDDQEEKWRKYIVTPGMHRIHHSDTPRETNSNYGFCFSLWDKFFRSYQPYPETGEAHMVMGLEEYRDPKYQTLAGMLGVPFNLKAFRLKHQKVPLLQFQPSRNSVIKPWSNEDH